MRGCGERHLDQRPRIDDLFEPPIVRNTDPVTSHIAAKGYSETSRPKDREIVRRLVRDNPGRTSAELSQIMFNAGCDWYKAARMPNKRLSELCDLNLVRRGTPRTCSKTKRTAVTYYAIT